VGTTDAVCGIFFKAAMKVHHEAWRGDRSTKRRFAVKEKDVDLHLAEDLSSQAAELLDLFLGRVLLLL
jgi:hypothetical protein